MNFYILLFLHFLADFILQSREMGKKKSTSWYWLTAHLSIQFFVFAPYTGFNFALANALLHGVIDKNIWNLYKLIVHLRITKQLKSQGWDGSMAPGNAYQLTAQGWKYWDDHAFYAMIGLDQMLHTTTLYFLSTFLT